jgi:anti-sigma B factor antagonist
MAVEDQPLQLVTSWQEGVANLRVAGELDLHTAKDFAATLVQILASDPSPHTVEIDASALEFVDSSGLRALLQAHSQAVSAGITLLIAQRSRRLQRLLDLTGLTAVF